MLQTTCKKCGKPLLSKWEHCPNCGAVNPDFNLDDKVNLRKDAVSQQNSSSIFHDVSENASSPSSESTQNMEFKRSIAKWIIGIVILLAIGILLFTSDNDFISSAGEGVIQGVFEGAGEVVLEVILLAAFAFCSSMIARAIAKNQKAKKQRKINESGNMATCRKCGNIVPEGSTFCNHCGTAITEPYSNVREVVTEHCPNCGISLTSEQKFCPKCHEPNSLYVGKSGTHAARNIAIAVTAAVLAAAVGFIIYSIVTVVQGDKNDSVQSDNAASSTNAGNSLELANNQLEFSATNNGTSYAVTGYTGNDTEITIPDTYNGFPVTAIGGYVFQNNTSIKSVSLNANMVGVGDYAFFGCSSLETVTFRTNDSNTDTCVIGESAFSECASLRTVNMPSRKISIERWAFSGCSNLYSINLTHVYRIGEGAFEFCNSLSTVNIKAQYIDDSAFSFCSGLKAVKVYNAEIADGVFEYCDNLEKFTGIDVVSIGSRAFGDCYNLTDVDLSGSPSANIANDAFEGSGYSYGTSSGNIYAATSLLGMTVDEAVSILGYNYKDNYMNGAMGHFYPDYGLAIPYGEYSINDPYITMVEVYKNGNSVSSGYGMMDKVYVGMSFREIFEIVGYHELDFDYTVGVVSTSITYGNVKFYFYDYGGYEEYDDWYDIVPSCKVFLS